MKYFVIFIREHLLRDRIADHGIVPDDLVDMIDIFDLILEPGYLGIIHPIGNKYGIGALAEILEQDILPLHRLYIIRQII